MAIAQFDFEILRIEYVMCNKTFYIWKSIKSLGELLTFDPPEKVKLFESKHLTVAVYKLYYTCSLNQFKTIQETHSMYTEGEFTAS